MSSNNNNQIVGWTYFIRDCGNGLIKIGKTELPHPKQRLAQLQTGNPNKMTLMAFVPGVHHEQELHTLFHERRVRGEWFEISEAEAFFQVSRIETEKRDQHYLQLIEQKDAQIQELKQQINQVLKSFQLNMQDKVEELMTLLPNEQQLTLVRSQFSANISYDRLPAHPSNIINNLRELYKQQQAEKNKLI